MIAQMEKLARLIIVQFNSTNPNVFSSWLRFNSEAPKKPGENIPSGVLIAGPTENVSVAGVIDQIGVLGYEPVDAFRRNIQNPKEPQKRYNVVYFLFSLRESAMPSEEFKKDKGRILSELKRLSRESIWSIRVFNNPFVADGVEIPGERSLLVNCQARMPLFENGKPILVWAGEKKVPRQPKEYLQIEIEREVAQVVAA